MFEACPGCGGFPDHGIESAKCVANRADAVREAQARLDAEAGRPESAEDFARRRTHLEEVRRMMVD